MSVSKSKKAPKAGKPRKETAPKQPKASKPPKAPTSPKKLSGLDAAAKVLHDAGVPMNMKSVMAEVQAKGLWKTNGSTPAATLYASVIREIKAKGKESRFVKADRGLFAARKAG